MLQICNLFKCCIYATFVAKGLKALEDINWDADWDETEELCGGDDSLCCIKKGNISDSEEAQVKTTRFAKHVDDDQICSDIRKDTQKYY